MFTKELFRAGISSRREGKAKIIDGNDTISKWNKSWWLILIVYTALAIQFCSKFFLDTP
jgi:hypothetical protein